MNRKTAISAFIALTMSAGQLSFAKGDEERQKERHGNKPKHHDNRDFGRSHNEEKKKGRGVGPNHEYYRGDRLPIEYRHRHYVVNDWRGHQLSAPPRGYQWVQSGNDYILIALATGIIAQFLLGR